MEYFFSAFSLWCLCERAHGFAAPIYWYPSTKSTRGVSDTKHFSSAAISNVDVEEGPQQRSAPESEILQSILDSKETTYHSLSDLRSYRRWDFSWPTITKPHRFTDRHTYASDRAFFAAIQAHNKGLTLDLLTAVGAFEEVNSVVLYGGALVDIVTKRENFIRDWDFRLVGDEYVGSPSKCIEAAKQFIRNVFAYLKKKNDRIQIANQERKLKGKLEEPLFDIQAVKTTRSQSTITVVVPGRGYTIQETILQFTFAPHATVKELLASCLPHCTRLAVKDNAVVLDVAAKYCLESLCVVLDADSFRDCCCTEEMENRNARSSMSAEIGRAIKYFDQKGFDIVLPKLDMEKLPVRNLEFDQNEVLDLPEMNVIYGNIEDKKIMAGSIQLANKKHRLQSGSNGYHTTDFKFDAAKFIHHNIRCLVADVYDQFFFWAEGEVVDPVFDYAPLLTGRMIDKAYETVKKNALASGSVNVNKVQRYFSATSPPKVLDQIFMDRLHSICKETESGSFQEPVEFDDKAIDALIAKEKDALVQKLSTIRDVLQKEDLDNIMVDFPSDVSSTDEILGALCGKYLLQED